MIISPTYHYYLLFAQTLSLLLETEQGSEGGLGNSSLYHVITCDIN